jgi:hypothetical protein
MSIKQKQIIINRLGESHVKLEGILDALDLDMVIHPETDWRIRDILGHIATWDRVLIRSIKSFLDRAEYIIPGMVGVETDFNDQKVAEQRDLPTAEIVKEWKKARGDFITAVQGIPHERMNDELNFPWGDERGSLSLMIEYMIDHNGEHQEEILDALKE